MDYLPFFLKHFDLNLQPSNSEYIDTDLARSYLYPGAHIATSNPYEHFHHGIVVDVDTPEISIIHLWGPTKETGRIQTTTLPIFLAGDKNLLGKKTRRLYLVNYEDDTLEKQQATVDVAKEMLEKADDIKYDLAKLNCESFACFCRNGQWKSEQIDMLKKILLDNVSEIYGKIKDADESNKRHIVSLLRTIPVDALNSKDRELYDELCRSFM
ncbi:unnamed protein product [Adineta ricciae]|uniref:LRAT domain-containing protein n=1 Tax=Adineta ricciae TaxID=249248 RepID=A0A815GGX3_ADIRI|nr:unnamed protein product [Adineta ricciae]